ncbi:TIGR00282 family metallophosphoesterase [Prosthecobacter sp. SYSU 5D2]|uniref:TIGR00282 family metallophosphoesterase n=1 Tax=Prosthecobacter sp. SYSU 5D2 TaxID=3134134 RepID=UPI0031FE9E67
MSEAAAEPATESAPELFRILFLGDVVGEPGRKAVAAMLPELRDELKVDFAIVNGENSAGGRGITPKIAISLMRAKADVITTGDHIWDQKEIISFLGDEPRLLRPVNYPEGAPGKGTLILQTKKGKVGIINLQGRTFMRDALENPFSVINEVVDEMRRETPIIFVDFHAEATSEKVAMGWHLDGKVSAVVGTHTHVPTADERVLPNGTAFQSDAGMCGPLDSVIGSQIEPVLEKFLTQLPAKFGVARGPVRINGALVTLNPATGKAVSIERIARTWEE